MPVPPTEIRIKRKATDDPVDLLHVQNEFNGIRQTRQYVFKRQRISVSPNNNAINPSDSLPSHAPRSIISFTGNQSVAGIKPLQVVEALRANSQGVVLESREERMPTTKSARATTNPRDGIEISTTLCQSEPRRFHLSRNSLYNSASCIRGAKGSPAVFIEQRRSKELTSKTTNAAIPYNVDIGLQDAPANQQREGIQKVQQPWPSPDAQARSPAPLRNIRPPEKVVPWDANSSTVAEMPACKLPEIGQTLVVSRPEASAISTPTIKVRQLSSFRPKARALRYHERYSQQAKATDEKKESSRDEIMTDATDTDVDESGYVMDTYIRVPAEMFDIQERKNIGLLVLDSQPDIDDFYNDNSDTDSEIYDDEDEDENAENHPSTDYPEDELESDDEYGRNPYKFCHNRNASDDDEYNEDDVTYSDDEAKYPWPRRPWMMNNPYTENDECEEEDN